MFRCHKKLRPFVREDKELLLRHDHYHGFWWPGDTEPGHQQSCYWPNFPGVSWHQHHKSFNAFSKTMLMILIMKNHWQIYLTASWFLLCPMGLHTCGHFCYKMVHCGIWDWCIVGFVQHVCLSTFFRCHCKLIFLKKITSFKSSYRKLPSLVPIRNESISFELWIVSNMVNSIYLKIWWPGSMM